MFVYYFQKGSMNYCTVRASLKCEPQLWNSSRDLRRSLWQTNGWCVYLGWSVCDFAPVCIKFLADLTFPVQSARFFIVFRIQFIWKWNHRGPGYTGGDPFLNRLKTYIVFCTVPVMCAAKTIQLKALTRPNSHSVLPFGGIPSGFPSPGCQWQMKVCSVPLLHIQMLLVTVTGGVDPRNT